MPPLSGLKVLEFAGLAPGPFAGMLLADAGADVLRIDRPGAPTDDDLLTRRKASAAVDLKQPAGAALVRALARDADVLIDPFRPGVLERLGLGPAALQAANPRLVYARLSGFRRDGRYRDMAGHDINYLAVSGVLALLGRAGAVPTPPWNMLADFAGGGLMLVLGVLLALAARDGFGGAQAGGGGTGRGQVVEASMVDGAAFLATFVRFALKTPLGHHPRGHNRLDTGCPFYDTYPCADADPATGRGYMAVGALEPRFFAILVDKLRLADTWLARREDRALWPALRADLAAAFARHPRAHWERVFDGTDACCTPVLAFAELEAGAGAAAVAGGPREGDQRPAVGLADTPLLAVPPDQAYTGHSLAPGTGAEDALRRWHGWAKGTDYDEQAGGLILNSKAKL